MSKLATFGISFSFLALAACPADDDTDTGASGSMDASGGSDSTGMTSATDSATSGMTGMTGGMSATTMADTTGGDPAMCLGAGGAAAAGDACMANDECASGVCLIYTDVPLDPAAVCGDFEAATVMGERTVCNTHVTGTLFDFSTLMPVSGGSLKVAGALNAITNPSGATALASDMSDAMGRVDAVTDVPVNQAIAIIALVEAPDYYLTATGLAAPVDATFYAPGTGIHDLWLVPQASLDAWTAALMGDPEVTADSLPLGDAGGVVGFVRDATGAPIAGAVVAPDAADSGAVVRYVAADNTITTDMTTETGIFIVINAAGTGEDFSATMGGNTIASGTAGTANGVVFTLILNGE
jgi:hypothetical protein